MTNKNWRNLLNCEMEMFFLWKQFTQSDWNDAVKKSEEEKSHQRNHFCSYKFYLKKLEKIQQTRSNALNIYKTFSWKNISGGLLKKRKILAVDPGDCKIFVSPRNSKMVHSEVFGAKILKFQHSFIFSWTLSQNFDSDLSWEELIALFFFYKPIALR